MNPLHSKAENVAARKSSDYVIGVDAANLRRGGGVTHLVELFAAGRPEEHGIAKIVVWAGAQTLAKLPDRPWLHKINPAALNGGLLRRSWWQRFELARAAREAHCDLLFVPGGSYVASFRPVVLMSQNLLPFEQSEFLRYGMSSATLKFVLLRIAQSRSFERADGTIFLSEFARRAVLEVTGELAGSDTIVPHGTSGRFRILRERHRAPHEFTDSNPCRLLYVSVVEPYKHQWHVVEAVHRLRKEGLPVVLDLVGPAYPPALSRLNAAVTRFDPAREFVHYRGAVRYETLHEIYAQADIGVFASSCETQPIILLEIMAAGLPVACSNRGPMSALLGDAGVYFNPEEPVEIAAAISRLVVSAEFRHHQASRAIERSQPYTWSRCAAQTFDFLIDVARAHRS